MAGVSVAAALAPNARVGFLRPRKAHGVQLRRGARCRDPLWQGASWQVQLNGATLIAPLQSTRRVRGPKIAALSWCAGQGGYGTHEAVSPARFMQVSADGV